MRSNDIFTLGVVGFLVYMLAPKEVKEKITGNMPGIGISIGDLLGGAVMPDINIPTEAPGDWQAVIDAIKKGFSEIPIPELPDKLPVIPPLVPTPTIPGIPGLPSWDIPDITLPGASQFTEAASKAGGVAARQYGSAILIGKSLPIPGGAFVKTTTAPLRAGAKLLPDIAKAAAEVKFPLTKTVEFVPGKLATHLAPRGAGALSAKAGFKVAAGAGKFAARSIPVVGWAMLIADAGADLLRLGGVDVTEWLGFSPFVGTFTGENPLEKWAAGQKVQGAGVFGLLDPAMAMAAGEAAHGQPEAPNRSEADWRVEPEAPSTSARIPAGAGEGYTVYIPGF